MAKKKTKRIPVTRYIQDPAHCAVAAISSVANFYDKSKDYEYVKQAAYEHDKRIKKEGMYTSDIGMVLNNLGFDGATVVSTDLDIFDYEWEKISKKNLVDKLSRRVKGLKNEYKEITQGFLDFLNYSPKNKIVISYDFGKHIREYLDSHRPLILSYNWSMFHKWGGTIKSGEEYHAVVAHGYDSEHVFITDSHEKHYTYRLSKYRNGKYKIKWEHLMTVMGTGDVLLPGRYKGA